MIRGALAALCTVGGLCLIVLAWQVHAWDSALHDDDLRFQVEPGAADLWAGPHRAGSGVARKLLAVQDDISFRRAEQMFVRVHLGASDYGAETERLATFGQAQSALAELARSDPSPERRARAGNLLGILLFEDAQSAQDNAPILMRQSLGAFRRAVRTFPPEADAKYNLELLMTILIPNDQQRRDAPEPSGGGGVRGAGLSEAGRGY